MKRVHDAVLHDTVNAHLTTTKVIKVDDLRIPLHFCFGHYEAATTEELDELIADLTHERSRRPTTRRAARAA